MRGNPASSTGHFPVPRFGFDCCCPTCPKYKRIVEAFGRSAYLIVADGDRVVDIITDGLDLTLQRGILFEHRCFDPLLLIL